MDQVVKYMSDKKTPWAFVFNKVDLKHECSQFPLKPDIQKHFKFSILGGKPT